MWRHPARSLDVVISVLLPQGTCATRHPARCSLSGMPLPTYAACWCFGPGR